MYGTIAEKHRMRGYKPGNDFYFIPGPSLRSPRSSRQLRAALLWHRHPCRRPGGRGSWRDCVDIAGSCIKSR